MNPPSEHQPPEPEDSKPPTFWQMLHSVTAAAFGAKREKPGADFTHGKPIHFAVIGLSFTLFFAALLFGVLQIVLYFALG